MASKLLLVVILAGISGGLCQVCRETEGSTRYILAFMGEETDQAEIGVTLMLPQTPITAAVMTYLISTPAFSGTPFVETNVLTNADYQKETILPGTLRTQGTEKSDKGVLVTTSSPIIVYGSSNGTDSCEGYLALPSSALGTEYIPITFWPPYFGAQLAIVADEDATTVQIVFPEDKGISFTLGGTTYNSGDTLTTTLNELETLKIEDFNDLTGSMISADKPVAVFSGNKAAPVNVDDFTPRGHMTAQLPPVDQWGREFYVYPFPDRFNTLVKFVAARNGTTVTMEGSTSGVSTWMAESDGDYRETVAFANSQLVTITADGPIMVVQYAESEDPNVPAMLLVPAVSQYRNDYTVTVPDLSTKHLLLTVESGKENGININGADLSATFVAYPNSNYVGYAYPITTSDRLEITHDEADVLIGAVFYAADDEGCTSAYPAGLCLQTTKVSTTASDATAAATTTTVKASTAADPTTVKASTAADPTTVKASTAAAPTTVKASTAAAPTTTEGPTEAPPNCSCPALFVTAPSIQKSLVGIYSLHSCLVADRQVYLHSSGNNYIYYNDSSSTWVFATSLEASATAVVESNPNNEDFPFDVAGVWQVFDTGLGWQPAETVSVQCICDKPVCPNVIINSTVEAHTFPGVFVYDSDFNSRPVYRNDEQNVYLYFHSRGDCHFWAVAASIDANQWLMYSYDISPRPNEVQATFEVARTAGWQEDATLKIDCV